MIDRFSPEIQVIYGQNEAGKSTIMAFIHAIFFGFPAKSQNELRYEPKRGFKYGGKITVETKAQRILTIERVAGRAAGDVRVTDQHGAICDIAEVLGGLDKTMYKGVFSFNIMDIQNLKLIDSDQLGGYLFSSGLIGNDQLHKLSQALTKEQEERFKPNGRKPVINKALNAIKEEGKAVQLWKQKMEQYDKLQDEIKSHDRKLSEINTQNKELSDKLMQVQAMLAMQPVLDKIARIELRAKNLKGYQVFPVDGISRLEKWQAEQTIYKAKYEKLRKDTEEKEKELNELQINTSLLENEEFVQVLLMEREKYAQAKNNFALLSKEKEKALQTINTLKNELSWLAYDEAEIENIDTSLASKAILRELLKEDHHLSLQKQRLDDQFQTAKDELEKQEERIAALEKELLSDEAVVKMKKAINEQSHDTVQKEIHITEQLVSQLNNQIQYEKKNQDAKKKTAHLGALMCILFGLAGAVILFIQDQLMFSVLFLLIFTVITFTLVKLNSSEGFIDSASKDKAALQDKLAALKTDYFSSAASSRIEEYKQALAKEEHVNTLLQKERLLLSQCERAYNKIIQQYEEWEKGSFSFGEKWEQWAGARKLDHISPSFMEEAYEKAVELKKIIRESQALKEKAEFHQTFINDYEYKAVQVLEAVHYKKTSMEKALTYLQMTMEDNTKKQLRAEKLKEALLELNNESNMLTAQLKELDNQIQQLFNQGEVENEEEFRLLSHRFAEGKELERELDLLQGQLKQMEKSYGIPMNAGRTMDVWQAEKDEVNLKLQAAKEEHQLVLEKRTAAKEMVRVLEEGGTYSDVVQQFELSKSNLQEHARKWAVYTTAQHLLNKTMEYYRTVKLPKVLENATRYFRILTNGNYVRVYDSSPERKLLVRHKDGTAFEPKELSQATIEQLYIALRFAVAIIWSEEEQFPLIMDDSFVNFDKTREDSAINLMKELARKGQQFLFFTCHKETKDSLALLENSMVYSIAGKRLEISAGKSI
jgi:uncharacterized protein YhaN